MQAEYWRKVQQALEGQRLRGLQRAVASGDYRQLNRLSYLAYRAVCLESAARKRERAGRP